MQKSCKGRVKGQTWVRDRGSKLKGAQYARAKIPDNANNIPYISAVYFKIPDIISVCDKIP